MRHPAIAALTALLVLAVTVPVSAASVMTGRDRKHGARFSLSGRTLTVTLDTSTKMRGFAGRLVRAECVRVLLAGDGPARTLPWPARRRSLKVLLPSSPGAAPVFCSVVTASLNGPLASIAATLE
jgi:hypothetical protein